jgi:LPXTG-motif cell wall-anchored protein
MMQVFNEATDPFVKVQFASFFSIAFSRIDQPTYSKLSDSVKTGQFTQQALDEFLATSTLVSAHAIDLDPHVYGELTTDFLRRISESPIQIPWLQQYFQDHPLPPPITWPPKTLPPEQPDKAEASPPQGWLSTASLSWLGFALLLLVGSLAWLRRRRKQGTD